MKKTTRPLSGRFYFFPTFVTVIITLALFFGYVIHSFQGKPIALDEYQQPYAITSILGVNSSTSVIAHGDRTKKQIALTFDADMTPGMETMLTTRQVESFYDEKLIATLIKSNTKATLFMTGLWIKNYTKIAKMLAKNSLFELENHSYTHGGFSGNCYGLVPSTDASDYQEITKTRDLLHSITGVKNVYFRFPGGCYDNYDLQVLSSLHMIAIQWDVAANDGFNNNLSQIEENVLSQVQNGSIIVMHMNGYPNEPQTADAVAFLIPKLKAEGYSFVTLKELLKK